MMKFCCTGAAVLAVTSVSAYLEAPERQSKGVLLSGPRHSPRLSFNQLVEDRGIKRTILNKQANEFRADEVEGNRQPSTDIQDEMKEFPYGLAQLYATLRADAYGITPAGEVSDALLEENQDNFQEPASSSTLASLAQLHNMSPPGSGQRKSGEAARQTSGALSVLRALGRPFVAVGSAALRAARELRKFLAGAKMSCSLELEDTKIGGKGSPIVAKAVARLGRVRKTSALEKVDQELELFLPRGQEIAYDCLDASQTIVLRREFPLGAGTFGFVVPFATNHDAKYAGKLFQVRRGEDRTMNNVRKQLNILNYLPPSTDAATALHTLRLGLPLCLIAKRAGPRVMQLPTKGKLLNAMILYPLLRGDVSYLTASLTYKKPEDRNVLLNITQQVVRAVSDLHRLGLAHLDIKLQNFLVTERGSILTGDLDGVKEFGTPVLPVMFTAVFAAPELARIVLQEDETATAQPTMDSWALGISIYGIWCAGFPFSKEFRKMPPAEQMEILHTTPSQTLVYDLECVEKMPPEVFNLMTLFLKPDSTERLTPIQALESHPAMGLLVPGGEDVRAVEEEEMPIKPPAAAAEPPPTPSTASTEETGRPPSLSSSYVYVKPEMVRGARSFQQHNANISTRRSDGFRFVGSYVRNPKPLTYNSQQQPSGSP
ncbi:Rhoptry kinase family protein ROP17, putative [Eimeria praecox]|uniref:Rhoptry kinase family protein ROP17, putative n=1 Tax=Eimeria praecox TaxID=51316 RepID=U6H5A8_9EIME|nr:Rhoptry kinase family protein ROP17, putative [Eimeria praecox]